jgi:hypothetical protein
MSTKFSQFTQGGQLLASDILVGLRAGNNTQFTWPSGSQIASGTLTNAQFCAIYATPQVLIPAPATGYGVCILNFYMQVKFSVAAFGAGGVVGLQYGSAPFLAGTNAFIGNATKTIPAAFFTGAAANQMTWLYSNTNTGTLLTAGLNTQAISISNTIAAFTPNAGTSTVNYAIEYIVVPMN